MVLFNADIQRGALRGLLATGQSLTGLAAGRPPRNTGAGASDAVFDSAVAAMVAA